MTKKDIKKAATYYVDNVAPFWMKAEKEDRKSSIEELTKFAEKILIKKQKILLKK